MQVFLSHSSSDKTTARRIAKALTTKGVAVWIDEGEIRIGESLVHKISTAISHVDYIIAVISINSVTSPWVTKELHWAMNREVESSKLTVLPIVLDNCVVPDYLRDKLYAPLGKPRNYGALTAKLIAAMDLAKQSDSPTSSRSSVLSATTEHPALHCFITGFAFGRAVSFLITPDRNNERVLIEFGRGMGLANSELLKLQKTLAAPNKIENLPVRLKELRQVSNGLKNSLNDFESNWFVLGELLPKLPMAKPLMGLIESTEELAWRLSYTMGRLNIDINSGVGIELNHYRLTALNSQEDLTQTLALLDSLPGKVAASLGFVEMT